MCNEKEVDAVNRDLNLLEKHVGKNVMRVIYLTLAVFFGNELVGFPGFAPSATQLLVIVIGSLVAMALGLGWVALRRLRRISLLAGENDRDKGSGV